MANNYVLNHILYYSIILANLVCFHKITYIYYKQSRERPREA